ncbi:MAG TPA: hypothetical protein VHX38_22005 [Pseudonocardiaceae bacterium]|nr:hypothetical protein [Pseudonocardiaceae bacterium]
MISRTPSSRGRSADDRQGHPSATDQDVAGSRRPDGPDDLRLTGRAAPRGRLWEVIALAAIGGVLTAIGPLFPMTSPVAPAGFSAGPMLFVLGLLPVAVAIGLAALRRPLAAGGALIAAAVFVPGRLATDVQFLVDAKLAEHPELVVPDQTSVALHGSTGVWLLLVGQLLTLVAGALIVGQGAERPVGADAAEQVAPRTPLFIALCVGVLGAVGLLAAPFHSGNPEIIEPDLWSGPGWLLIGGLLLAAAVPVVTTVAVTTTDPALTPGWLLGGAATLVAVALPGLVSGIAVSGLHQSIGPYLALIAAVAMLALIGFARRAADAAADSSGEQDSPGPELPGTARLHRATGILAVLAGIAALLGAVTNTFVLPAGLPSPIGYAERALLPTALIVGLLGIAMLVGRWAPILRPMLAVSLVTIPLAGAGALDAAFGGVGIAGVGLGPASWFTGFAILAGCVAAICAALAGGVERDDVDLTSVSTEPIVLVPSVLAAVLAIGAFGLPILRAAGYTEAGIVSNFQVTSWGLLVALVTVIIVGIVAPRCRPARAAALLLGTAAVLLVRLLELPLTRDRVAQSSAGAGTWLSAASLVLFLLAAVAAVVVALRRPTPPAPTRPARKAAAH